MLQIDRKVRQLPAADWQARQDELISAGEPVLLKGLVAGWPAARAGLRSVEDGVDYLRGFYQDATVGAWIGGPEIGGRFFYNDELTGFIYRPVMVKLGVVLDRLLQHRHNVGNCSPDGRPSNRPGSGWPLPRRRRRKRSIASWRPMAFPGPVTSATTARFIRMTRQPRPRRVLMTRASLEAIA